MRQMNPGDVLSSDQDDPEMAFKTMISSVDQNLFCKDDYFLHDEKENLPPPSVLLVSFFFMKFSPSTISFHDQLHLFS